MSGRTRASSRATVAAAVAEAVASVVERHQRHHHPVQFGGRHGLVSLFGERAAAQGRQRKGFDSERFARMVKPFAFDQVELHTRGPVAGCRLPRRPRHLPLSHLPPPPPLRLRALPPIPHLPLSLPSPPRSPPPHPAPALPRGSPLPLPHPTRGRPFPHPAPYRGSTRAIRVRRLPQRRLQGRPRCAWTHTRPRSRPASTRRSGARAHGTPLCCGASAPKRVSCRAQPAFSLSSASFRPYAQYSRSRCGRLGTGGRSVMIIAPV